MTDPRILLMQPVDEPLYGRAARAAAEALNPPVDEPLWGATAKRIGEALRVRRLPGSVA